ncbi:MAG: AlpA family phage regulatory protein [Deltaproteobacteria bacterium]|nr:AlpA family phage regulatory protein [Deltaproteobacteria bacterium]
MAKKGDGHTSYKKLSLDDAVYLRRLDVAALLRCSPSHVYELVKRGLLPRPVRLSPSYSVWKKADVLAAMEKVYAENAV